jgi:hypothetical protein
VAGETARQMGLTLLDRLQTRDLAAQHRQLAVARVKYVILHRPKDGLFAWKAADGAWNRYVHTYRMVDQDQDMMVLRVF